jgi:hypothetical protein
LVAAVSALGRAARRSWDEGEAGRDRDREKRARTSRATRGGDKAARAPRRQSCTGGGGVGERGAVDLRRSWRERRGGSEEGEGAGGGGDGRRLRGGSARVWASFYRKKTQFQPSVRWWTAQNEWSVWALTGFVSFMLYLAFFFFFFRFMHHCEVAHTNNNLICTIIFFKYNILHISCY